MSMRRHLKAVCAPLLVAIIPIVFLYSHNVNVLNLNNLVAPLLIATAAALILYGLFFLLRRDAVIASLSAIVMLLANFLYGTVYTLLVRLDRLPVEHYTLLPVA